MLTVKGKLMIFLSYGNYVGVRIYQGIWMIKRSEMRPLGGAAFWNSHLPAVATILAPFLVCLLKTQNLAYQVVPLSVTITCVRAWLRDALRRQIPT